MKRGITILLLACVQTAHAGETESFWVIGGFLFNDPLSWNGPVPDETVTCIFDIDAKFGSFVGFEEDGLSDRLIIRTGAVDMLLWDYDGEGYVARQYGVMNSSFNTPSVVVGESMLDTASLHLDGGILNAQSLVLGMGVGSFGVLEFGTGLSGLTPSVSCAYGLHVGGSGQGLLTIDNGVVVTASETVIGVSSGSLGETILTNPDSRLDVAGLLIVGKQGQGILTVDDQADLTSLDALIGLQPGSEGAVTLTGQGATWINDGSVDVGFQGQGSLTVTGGAAVFTHGFAVIGSFPDPVFPPATGGVGDVTISGLASLWVVDGDLYVGLQWVGRLDILDGAIVTSQSGIVGFSGHSNIVANIEGPGSLWSTVEDVTVFSDALLRLADGGIVFTPLVDVLDEGTLEAHGSVIGDVYSTGTIRIGDPLGVLDVQGDLVSTGDLQIDVGEPFPGGFDAMLVSGSAAVSGSMTVSIADGYEPQVGDVFEVVTAASLTAMPDTVSLPATSAAGVWHYTQDADSIDVFLTPLGDVDGDGVVGINDFLLLLAAWGPCPVPPAACTADLDGDGMVGITDFLILLAQWSA